MKYLIAGCLFLLASLSTVAQTELAVHAGYNHNTASVDIAGKKQSTGYLPGIHIGGRIKTGFEPPLYFVGMLSYNLRGFVLKPSVGDTSRLEARIHYIDIAPMLNYDFKLNANNKIGIIVGPAIGVALSGKQKITEDGATRNEQMKLSFSNNYGYVNVGIQAGLNYQFNKMFLEGTYHLGVTSINNNEEFDDTNIKNRGFAISLGYWFK